MSAGPTTRIGRCRLTGSSVSAGGQAVFVASASGSMPCSRARSFARGARLRSWRMRPDGRWPRAALRWSRRPRRRPASGCSELATSLRSRSSAISRSSRSSLRSSSPAARTRSGCNSGRAESSVFASPSARLPGTESCAGARARGSFVGSVADRVTRQQLRRARARAPRLRGGHRDRLRSPSRAGERSRRAPARRRGASRRDRA
jgi:hypothetical protein